MICGKKIEIGDKAINSSDNKTAPEETNKSENDVYEMTKITDSMATAGVMGGVCECPDGRSYMAGDVPAFACSRGLACEGGKTINCYKFKGEWSYKHVICGHKKSKEDHSDQNPANYQTLFEKTKRKREQLKKKAKITKKDKTPSSNYYYRDESKNGWWGGYCKCPDGKTYPVADRNDKCGS